MRVNEWFPLLGKCNLLRDYIVSDGGMLLPMKTPIKPWYASIYFKDDEKVKNFLICEILKGDPKHIQSQNGINLGCVMVGQTDFVLSDTTEIPDPEIENNWGHWLVLYVRLRDPLTANGWNEMWSKRAQIQWSITFTKTPIIFTIQKIEGKPKYILISWQNVTQNQNTH